MSGRPGVWLTPLISASGRQREADLLGVQDQSDLYNEFQASQGYRVRLIVIVVAM